MKFKVKSLHKEDFQQQNMVKCSQPKFDGSPIRGGSSLICKEGCRFFHGVVHEPGGSFTKHSLNIGAQIFLSHFEHERKRQEECRGHAIREKV